MDDQVIAIEHEIFGQTLEELLLSINPIVAGLLEKALAGSELSCRGRLHSGRGRRCRAERAGADS